MRRVKALWLAMLVFAIGPAAVRADGTTFPLFPYWEDGKSLTWYNFGSRSPVKDGFVQAQRVWIMTAGLDSKGAPSPLVGQGPIFDVNVGEPGYSDLAQIVWVQAPPGYRPNSLKSRAEIDQARLVQTVSEIFVNRPFAAAEDRLGGTNEAPYQGWVRGEAMWCFDLGPASPKVGQDWRFVSGVNAQGQPAFVNGQYTVSDSSPAAFRELFLVEAPQNYVPNSITTVAQVQSSGFPIRAANAVFNVPLPIAEAAPASIQRTAASYGIIAVFVAAWLACCAYLLRLPRPTPSTTTRPEPAP